MKKCSNKNCIHKGKLQPLDNFNRDNVRSDGRSGECKSCINTRRTNSRVFKRKERQFDKLFEFI